MSRAQSEPRGCLSSGPGAMGAGEGHLREHDYPRRGLSRGTVLPWLEYAHVRALPGCVALGTPSPFLSPTP